MTTANFRFAQLQPFALYGGGAVAGDTSITLASMKDIDGNALSMANDFGSIGFGTLEPGSGTLEEQICFTGLVNNSNGTTTLTGVKSVGFTYPYTQTSGLAKNHAGSTTFIISNTAGFYDKFVAKDDDGTISETLTFTTPNFPQMSDATTMPTVQAQLATKAYADSLAILGAPNATTSVQGLVQLGTQAQVDASTATGSTGASLVATPATMRSHLLSDYAADTGAADAYAIAPSPAITAYATGQMFSFKAANTNTTASTLAVNGLTTKTIKKGGTIDLGAGDIISGQLVVVQYDGTNFQMISPVSGQAIPTGAVQMFTGAAAPSGWLFCDASAISRTTYAALYAVIGTTYGVGNGSTTFNLPDMRGRVPVGVGTGTGGGAAGTGAPTGGTALTAVALSTWKGEETHVLTTTEMPSHTHAVGSGAGVSNSQTIQGGAGSNAGGTSTGSAGSDGAHNTIQPVLGINFIIKT